MQIWKYYQAIIDTGLNDYADTFLVKGMNCFFLVFLPASSHQWQSCFNDQQ